MFLAGPPAILGTCATDPPPCPAAAPRPPGQLRLALAFDDQEQEHELPRESAGKPPGWTAAGVVERAGGE